MTAVDMQRMNGWMVGRMEMGTDEAGPGTGFKGWAVYRASKLIGVLDRGKGRWYKMYRAVVGASQWTVFRLCCWFVRWFDGSMVRWFECEACFLAQTPTRRSRSWPSSA